MNRNGNYILAGMVLMCLVTSCVYTEKPSAAFLSVLNNDREITSTQLRFGGAYHRISDDNYHHPVEYKEGKPVRFVDTPWLESPLFFFKNGQVLYSPGLSYDSLGFDQWLSKYALEKWTLNNWGTYTVNGDTLNALIYVMYNGPPSRRRQLRETRFRGWLRGDSLLQWQIMPPYPDVLQQYEMNSERLSHLRTPRNLGFKPVPVINRV
ncbi:MAG: hypothetical protein JNM68_06040, partial [Dinghuibacter sp.]|nr:hypothetical protein [Dinghuibacter sp.]